ncbi:MAG: type II toxin-antitoxin system PemK/MazF family toxin [Propionibacteriaceae bacterium]|jgi:mRNA interferase MazF|nr:type II toxin-antitoxin system PemK/MazF family toxin [Propionibacteriaceae bacterium]
MHRGEVWTLRDERYASKARPVVVVQSDQVSFDSVVVCLFTTFDSSTVSTRILIPAAQGNGLTKDSYVMTEKLASISSDELGSRIGVLTKEQMSEVARGIRQVLAL